MTNTVFLGDYGYTITIDCNTDITDNDSLTVILSEPDSTNFVSKTGALSGTDSVICTIENGDITRTGNWLVQAVVTTATGVYHSTTNTLTVIEPED